MSRITNVVPPQPSALSDLLAASGAGLPFDSLPLEVLHNLQHQHDWTNLRIHTFSPQPHNNTPSLDASRSLNSDSQSPKAAPVKLIQGLPSRHIYTHPDFQAHLVKNDMIDLDVPVQEEWVLPMSIGEKTSLRRFSEVFESLPVRQPLIGAKGHQHRDAKRVLLGMLSHNGMGGDGTIVYYIMQESDVKPRQN